jgi:hypothetical protein
MVEVAVKEPKHIATGLARMSAMLAGKTTPDRATMLHSEFPISPTWRANYQGVRPGQIRKGATQAVVGGLVGGSRLKSVDGSSWIELGTRREWQGRGGFRLVQASGE